MYHSRTSSRLSRAALIYTALLLIGPSVYAAEFIRLGDLPGNDPFVLGDFWSVTNDGRHVLGTIRDGVSGGDVGFSWTADTGIELLHETYGILQVREVSSTGSIAIGLKDGVDGSGFGVFELSHPELFRFLAIPPGLDYASPYGISGDGSVIVGTGEAGSEPLVAVRWENDSLPNVLDPVTVNGKVVIGPTLARSVSSSGKTIVGTGVTDNDTREISSAFRWTPDEGARPLLPIASGTSDAWDVTDEGHWIVGLSYTEDGALTGRQALRWDDDGNPHALGPEILTWGSGANHVSGDGSVISGVIYPSEVFDESYPALWTESTGLTSLQEYLIEEFEMGEELADWRLWRVYDISDNGRYLTGVGYNPDGNLEGFVVDLSTGRRGDLNENGTLDAGDIDQLSLLVRAQDFDAAADFNEDSRVDAIDRDIWTHQLFGTFYGDANLDGEFNTNDLVTVFQASEYEDGVAGNSGWSTGDWNGDGEFNSSDLTLAFQDGGYEQGPKSPVVSVPEPSSCVLIIISGILLVARRRS